MDIPEGAITGVHDAVRERLARRVPGRLLDAPSGHGAMAAWAAERGWSVTACDLDPDVFEAPGLSCDGVDLNGPLPYPDASFDAVTCVEGIEHVEHQFGLIRELRRVLRPGGVLIVTTPNVGSIPARLRYFATGMLPYFDFDWTLRQWGHITPISLPELAIAMERAGLAITSVQGNRIKPMARVLAPLATPIGLVTRRQVGVPMLAQLLTTRAALLAEILVIEAS